MCSVLFEQLEIEGKPVAVGHIKEWITPHKISLLVLVKHYCDASSSPGHRKFLFKMLDWLQGVDLSPLELISQLSEIEDFLKRMLLVKLQDICQGLSDLCDFIQAMSQLVSSCSSQPRVSRSSVLGMFIRHMVLAFDKLEFSQTTCLLDKLQHYVQEMITKLALKDAQDDKAMTLEDLEDPKDSIEPGSISRKHAEIFVMEQISLLQNSESAVLPSAKMRKKISQLLHYHPELSEAIYLSYLDSTRAKDYTGAANSLRRYFDQDAVAANGFKPYSDEVGKSYCSAALNLASLYCRFGHREEALDALKESIRLAQESNDHACLQHALTWLCRLEGEDSPDLGLFLERAVSKAKDLNIPYLSLLGIQSFCSYKAKEGTPPKSIFEWISGSDVLNCQCSMLDLLSTSLAQQSALWMMYGFSELSSVYCQLMLRMWSSQSYGRQGENLQVSSIDDEALCLAHCHLALQHFNAGHQSAAHTILKHLKTRFPPQSLHAKLWMLVEQQILFESAVHCGKLQLAEQAVRCIAAINKTEALYRKAILLMEKENYPAMQKILNQLKESYQTSKENLTPELYAKVLLAVGDLHSRVAQYPLSIGFYFQCLAVCKQFHLNYLAALATAHLAEVQLLMGLPQQSLKLVEHSLPAILSHGSLYDKCWGKWLLVRCQLAASIDLERKPVLLSSVRTLSQVNEGFTRLEASGCIKKVLLLQAMLYNELGYVMERNKCALHFKQLEQHKLSSSNSAM